MKNDLNILGLSFEQSIGCVPKKIVIIRNPDKSIRWIVPIDAKKALFLKFYALTNLKSKIKALCLKLLFDFKLAKFVFTTQTMFIAPSEFDNQVDFLRNDWTIFTGTKGPNRKILLYCSSSKCIFKVGLNENSNKLLLNENNTLLKLNNLSFTSLLIPLTKYNGTNVLCQNDISLKGNRNDVLTELHKKSLNEIYGHTRQKMLVFDLPMFKNAVKKLEFLEQNKDSTAMPSGLIRKLRLLFNTIENKDILVALNHGDFTPWNMYTERDKLAVYDWELSNKLCPIGYDAFHFVLQNGILIQRANYHVIHANIKNQVSQQDLNSWAGEKVTYNDYYKLFLFLHITYYASLYAKQINWHAQVSWQIQIWSQSMSVFLEASHNHRQLLLMDFFDYLFYKNYSAVKFFDYLPESLSEYADIDLLVNQKEFHGIKAFFKNHILVKSTSNKYRSNKGEIQVFTNDGLFLSVDLIWKLKRKWMQYLEVNKLILNVGRNSSGVKVMSSLDVARYVACFNLLNKQSVPCKFHDFAFLLEKSNKRDDFILFSEFLNNKPDFARIEALYSQKKYNKNENKICNIANYFIDTIRDFLYNKGVVITFSGVDGAGKSTIIEQTKHTLIKKYRKRVVVLRHRPSLLPILSTYIKGKNEAEKQAATSLPRKGTNKSIVGSVIRFSYYYFDYLVGQLYVYLKYVMRGYIVLYDRYYFDFINDSLRSNINMPKWIAQSGYVFLIKPDFNFFLYADVNTILSRKKELEGPVIAQLTSDYLKLFNSFQKKSKNVYCAIENLEIDVTLKAIFNKTLPKII